VVNKPKARGTQTEVWVTNYARETYWPHAKRLALAGKNDIGDLDLHEKLMVEVKVADARFTVGPWMQETDIQQWRKQADYGVLVMKPRTYGQKSVSRFIACMRAGPAYKLLWDTKTIAATEAAILPSHKIDPLVVLARMEREQATVGNMYNMATYRVRAEEDPDRFYSFMRLGPLFELLNLAGYGKYLEARDESVEDKN
jgi:hypothetical protein